MTLLGTLAVSVLPLPFANARTGSGTTIFRSFPQRATCKTILFGLLVSIFTILLIPASLHAQVKTGDNLSNISANSILERERTTKALLLPRLNQTQIDAMQNVPAGMLVYNSTMAGISGAS